MNKFREDIFIQILELPNDDSRNTITFEKNGFDIKVHFYAYDKSISIRFGNIIFKIEYIGIPNNTDYKAIFKMVENILNVK